MQLCSTTLRHHQAHDVMLTQWTDEVRSKLIHVMPVGWVNTESKSIPSRT